MAVRFHVERDENYFISIWTGKITDQEILDAYKRFYTGPTWSPGMHELVDLADADFAEVTPAAIASLAAYVAKTLEEHGVQSSRAAVFCGRDLEYGVARMYDVFSEGSPEYSRVFRDREKARAWVKGGDDAVSSNPE